MIKLKPKIFLQHLFFELIFIVVFTDSKRIVREQEDLSVKLRAVHSDSVDLVQRCACSETEKNRECFAHYWTCQSNKMQQHFNNTTDDTLKLHVGNLQKNTKYTLYLRCRCCSVWRASGMVTFITEGSSGSNTNSSRGYNCTSDDDSEMDNQPIMFKENTPFSNVLDTTLGIVFALVGLAIAVVTVYCLWKGWRRRQRILQIFRQPENSDRFDMIQQNMEQTA